MDDIEEEAYLYICGASKETCRDVKISDTVYDFMELLKDNKGIISKMPMHEEVRKVLGIIHKARSCIFQSSIEYNLQNKRWEIITHLGKPNSLLPVFKPEMINKWVKTCKKNIIVFPIGFYSSKLGHANIVIVNKKKKTIEHFEPHGAKYYGKKTERQTINKEYPKLVKNLFKQCCFPDYKYIAPKRICPKFGIQAKQGRRSNYEGTKGSCAWWSIWYMNVRIAHPDLSPEEAYEKAFNIAVKNISDDKNKISENLDLFLITFIKKLISITDFKIIEDDVKVKISDNKFEYYVDYDETIPKKEILGIYKHKMYGIGDRTFNSYVKLPDNFFIKKSQQEDKILNPKTNRYVSKTGKIGKELLKNQGKKQCPEGKILNPKTSRCVDKYGKVGKKILNIKLNI